MTATSEIDQQILDAAVRLIAVKPWPQVALADVARESGLSIAEIYRIYPSRLAILCGLHRRVDLEMLTGPPESGPARDRLFDLLMRRFDALASLKPAFTTGLAELRRGRLGTLEAALVSGLNLHRSMIWLLEAAGLAESCLVNTLRAKVLTLAYLTTFRVWLDDDSADLARTMVALDKSLDRATRFLRLRDAPSAPRPAEPASEGTATEAPAK